MASEPSSDGGLRGRARFRRALLVLTAGIATLTTVAAGVGYGGYIWAQRQFEDVKSGIDPVTKEPYIGGKCTRKACNYLLLGSDSRTGLSEEELEHFGTTDEIGGERSDTIILIHLDPKREQAVILHFPRDLWVQIPGMGMGRINGAFAGGVRSGGPDRVAETIENLTGLHINHFLYVNFEGFKGVVDALGGVPMCVDRPMKDVLAGLDIPAGCQDFDGATALAFVRSRHQCEDKIPDFARIARQQQFLRAVLSKLLSPSQIVNLPGLVRPVAQNMVKDEGFPLLDIAYLAENLDGTNTGTADFRAVPTTPGWETLSNGLRASVVHLEPEAETLFDRLVDGKPLGELGKQQPSTLVSPANVTVSVHDANSGEKAQEVLTLLEQGGFDAVPELAPAEDLGASGTQILYAPGHLAEGKRVQRFLPNIKLVKAEPRQLHDVDVAVVITSRYRPKPPGTGKPSEGGC